jgi:hypothetical protein
MPMNQLIELGTTGITGAGGWLGVLAGVGHHETSRAITSVRDTGVVSAYLTNQGLGAEAQSAKLSVGLKGFSFLSCSLKRR